MPRRWLVRIVVVCWAVVVGAGAGQAQSRPAGTPRPGVMVPVKVTKEAASAAALRQVPGGRLQAIALGLINGKAVYTAFVLIPDRPGRITVVIDANTGGLVRRTP